MAGKVLVKTNTLAYNLPPNTNTEFEYSIKPTENIQPNTVYYFRVPGGEYPIALPSLKTSSNINSKSNTITNGSFEMGLENWVFNINAGAAATTSFDKTQRKEGVQSLKVNVTQTIMASDVSLTHQPVETQVGKVYLVRFWAYSTKNGSKMQLAITGNKKLTYDYKLYTGWQQFQFAFKAFEPTVALSFLFQFKTEYHLDLIDILDENNEEVDVPMNYMWQNKRPVDQYAWLSADGENSVGLPDGRAVWTFSDGWYGYNDTTTNSMSTHQLLRNTLVVQSEPPPDGTLITKIGGTLEKPDAIMKPPNPHGHDNFFWPRDMIVENDSLKILLPDVVQWNPGDVLMDGDREAVGVFSLPDLTLRSIEWMPWLSKQYYIALCRADDGFTYAYGGKPVTPVESYAVVARFPTGMLNAVTPWQFLTDTGWSYTESNSKNIADVQLFSVAKVRTLTITSHYS